VTGLDSVTIERRESIRFAPFLCRKNSNLAVSVTYKSVPHHFWWRGNREYILARNGW